MRVRHADFWCDGNKIAENHIHKGKYAQHKQSARRRGVGVGTLVVVALAVFVAPWLSTENQKEKSSSTQLPEGNYREYHNAGIFHSQQADFEQAEIAYCAAQSLAPGFAESAVQLALVNTNQGKAADAANILRAFRQSTKVDGLRFTAPHKLVHDIEQSEYLESTGVATKQAISVCKSVLAELTEAQQQADENSLTKLTSTQSDILFKASLASMYVPDDADPLPEVINRAFDFKLKEEEYLASSTVVLDNILTPEALESLYQFCLASTMWQERWIVASSDLPVGS